MKNNNQRRLKPESDIFIAVAKKEQKATAGKKESKPPFFKRHLFETVIFLFSFLLYCNSIPNDYNLDDELVTRNHYLTSKGISAIPEIFVSPYYKDEMRYAYGYRPIVFVSFAIEHSLSGENPHVSHFINVLLYSLCCLLLFLVLKNLFNGYSVLLSFGAALLFAAHPAHTEVVCSIKNRDEILGLIFTLLSLWFAIQSVNKSRWYLPLIALSFSLALMSKLTFISFALIIPVAVILFCETDFYTAMFVAVMLALPAFFLTSSTEFYYRLLLETGVIGGAALLYLSLNPAQLSVWFSRGQNIIPYSPVFESPSPAFIPKWKELLPGRNDLNLFLFASTALCVLIFILGLHWNNEPMLVFASVAILATEYFAKADKKMIPYTGYLVCLLLGYLSLIAYVDNKLFASVLSNLVTTLVAFELFFGPGKLRLPSLAFIICTMVSYFIIHAGYAPKEFFEMFLIAWLLRTPKRKRVLMGISVTMMIISCYYLYQAIFGLHLFDYEYDKVNFGQELIAICIVLGIYSKYVKPLLKALLLIGVVASLPFSHHMEYSRIPEQFDNMGRGINTTIYTGKTDRPISFIENPVTAKDALDIRAGTAMEILFMYLHKVIIPYPMSYYYGYKFIRPQHISGAIPVISSIIYLALFLLMLYLTKHNPFLGFALLIYLVSVACCSDIFQYIPGLFGERFMLVPSLGWCVLFAGLLFMAFKLPMKNNSTQIHNIPKGAKYAFLLVLVFYSVITFGRNFEWKDDLTLFRHDINYVDNSAQAHNLLALHLMVHSEKEPERLTELATEAAYHFNRAVEIYPAFFNGNFDLGRVYVALNMPDSAISAFKRALALDKEYSPVQYNIGTLLMNEGRFSEAIPYFEQVIKLNPGEYTSYGALTFIYAKLNEPGKAIDLNHRAAEVIHNIPDPIVNIARAYISINQSDSARYYTRLADKMFPGNAAVGELFNQLKK